MASTSLPSTVAAAWIRRCSSSGMGVVWAISTFSSSWGGAPSIWQQTASTASALVPEIMPMTRTQAPSVSGPGWRATTMTTGRSCPPVP